MEIWKQLLIVCPLAFLAALVDSIAGGGGLISLPAYYAAGLPPHMAQGTNKLSAVFGSFVSTLRFLKSGEIKLVRCLPGIVAALTGSALGTRLALVLDEAVLRVVLLVLLPALTAFLLLRRAPKEEKTPLPARRTLLLCVAVGFFIGAYDGFFGPGAGTLLIVGLHGLARLPLLESMGYSRAITFASNISSLVMFALGGKVVFWLGCAAAVFSVMGGYVGAGLALTRGGKVVRPIMVVVLLLLIGKIVWDMLPVSFLAG